MQLPQSWIIEYLALSSGYYLNIGSVIYQVGLGHAKKGLSFLVYFDLYFFSSTHKTLFQGRGPFACSLEFQIIPPVKSGHLLQTGPVASCPDCQPLVRPQSTQLSKISFSGVTQHPSPQPELLSVVTPLLF